MTNLLGASEIRELAAQLDLKPTKKLGQNFVVDSNICRKIVKLAQVGKDDIALEIGPGLGSLTLALLDSAQQVVAVEIDDRLAKQLPITVENHGFKNKNLMVINQDAMQLREISIKPTVLVANLPYNISVPVLLNTLEHFPSINRGVVMVQSEVAERLAAKPNNKQYGSPTVKANWWSSLSLSGSVSRSVFWPVPNVDSSLVRFDRHPPLGSENERVATFAVIDLLNTLEHFPSINRGVVMVQSEVAERLAAKPNNKQYGSPTVKANWWSSLSLSGSVSRSVFWPVPNVDSSLVRFDRHPPLGSENERVATFAVIDQAFAKRRKMMRAALNQLTGTDSEKLLLDSGIDPTIRGEALSVAQFFQIGKQVIKHNSSK